MKDTLYEALEKVQKIKLSGLKQPNISLESDINRLTEEAIA